MAKASDATVKETEKKGVSNLIKLEMKNEVVFFAIKPVYREKGLPCCPGTIGSSGRPAYCIKAKGDTDEFVNAKNAFLATIYAELSERIGNNMITIGQGRRLKLDDEEDYLIYNLMLLRDDVAMSQADYSPSIHVGYIVNEVQESVEVVGKAALIEKALSYINKNGSADVFTHVAMYCKLPTRGSTSVIQSRIVQLAIEEPKRIIEFYESTDVSIIIYIQTLINSKIITRKDGAYMFGTTVLGSTVQHIVTFINDDKNAIAVERLNVEFPYEAFSFGAADKNKI